MHRLRKKHCESWYGRIYYAADKQFGIYLLQQYFVRCRRRYLHICYDDCAPWGVRQLVETPIYAMNEGTSPILSYNYGACRPARVRKAMAVMSTMILGYTAVMWSIIILFPNALIGIFSLMRP